MEGNHSLAGMILVEYQSIIDFLKSQLRRLIDFELKAMLKTMIKKTETYLTKALACNAIILATVLNPSYQISIFELYFPSHCEYAKSFLQQQFTKQKAELAADMESRQPSPQTQSQP